MFGIHRHFPTPGGGSTADATAKQWQIKSGETAYIATGKVTGNAYTPAMMQFNGSSYFSDTFGTSGNKFTCVVRFSRASFSGGGREALVNIRTASNNRLVIWVNSSDYSVADERNKISVYGQNSASATAFVLVSTTSWCDGDPHTLFVEYDGDAGTAVLRIDGVSDINTGATNHTVTSATLSTSSAAHYIGCRSGPTDYFNGELGFVGYRDVGGLTWSDFMQTDGAPIGLDEATWTEWGSTQPLLWNPHGDARDNRGSSGAWSQTGTIVVGDGGAT